MASAKNFSAVLERSGDRLNWTIIRVPFDVAKLWGKRGQLRVKGEINGFPFRTSLFPDGKGAHIMMVNKQMQAGGKAIPGKEARFRMEPDTEKRETKAPAELLRVLAQSKRLEKYFMTFNLSTRNEIARWIGQAKSGETRRRRADAMAERMMQAMEGERELPPILKVELARNPKARHGWELMPASHRRWHLMGIFGYRSPESRARRVAKAMVEMVQYAEKRERKP